MCSLFSHRYVVYVVTPSGTLHMHLEAFGMLLIILPYTLVHEPPCPVLFLKYINMKSLIVVYQLLMTHGLSVQAPCLILGHKNDV